MSFCQVGEDLYSCVAPPGFEKDPAVTRAIQEFDPGALPIWRIQRWAFPGADSVHLVVHHGIGRYYPFPRQLRRRFYVRMPVGAEYPAPNFLDAIFEDTESPSYRMGGPGEYMPWDWSVYRWCRRQFDRITKEKYLELIERHRERMEEFRRKFEEEVEYRKKQIEPWILKQLDERVADQDWAALLAFHAENQSRRARGLDPIRRQAPQLYVGASGRSPRPDETYGRVAPGQVKEPAV